MQTTGHLKDPRDLPNPSLEQTSLSKILIRRAKDHAKRDKERRLNRNQMPITTGSCSIVITQGPREENDSDWTVQVHPDQEYLENPKLAGSAWLHKERRHMEGG